MEPLSMADNRNTRMLRDIAAAFHAHQGPRIGDFCRMPDGSLRRFTYDWGDSIQLTMPKCSAAYHVSFYLGTSGYADFSGSLDSPIDKNKLTETEASTSGRFWVFDQGIPGGGRGRWFDLPCRIFEAAP